MIFLISFFGISAEFSVCPLSFFSQLKKAEAVNIASRAAVIFFTIILLSPEMNCDFLVLRI